MRPTSAPCHGMRFPKARIRKNDAAGISGIIQAWSSTASPSVGDVVEVDAVRLR